MEMQLSQVILRGQEADSYGGVPKREMAALEQNLCEYVGISHCVSVDSSTTGMLLALKAAGVGDGDLVLYTSFSYFATPEIIELAGAEPIPVDINPNTFNVDPYCLEYIIGKCQRDQRPTPKALVAVDLFGLPCNYEALQEICTQHGICLIEDMAQSFGAAFKGRRTGGFGRMAVASFFATKPLDEIGEGGAVFCHTAQDAYRLESLRRKVRMQDSGRYIQSTGSCMDAVQASIVQEKLETLDFELTRRKAVAARYWERLAGKIKMQHVADGYASAYTQFAVCFGTGKMRDQIAEELWAGQIPCYAYEPSPMPGNKRDRPWNRTALVNTKSIADRLLLLPMHPYLNNGTIDHICGRLLESWERVGCDETEK